MTISISKDGRSTSSTAKRRDTGDESCFLNSPFGGIYDIIAPDATRNRANVQKTLGAYKAAFVVGDFRKEELPPRVFEDYAAAGGTLFVSGDKLAKGIVDANAAGVTFGKKTVSSGKEMVEALRHDDVNDMLDALSCFFANIPANITVKREKYYQSLFYAVFVLIGARTHAECWTNRGRVDAVVETPCGVYVFEFKLGDGGPRGARALPAGYESGALGDRALPAGYESGALGDRALPAVHESGALGDRALPAGHESGALGDRALPAGRVGVPSPTASQDVVERFA